MEASGGRLPGRLQNRRRERRGRCVGGQAPKRSIPVTGFRLGCINLPAANNPTNPINSINPMNPLCRLRSSAVERLVFNRRRTRTSAGRRVRPYKRCLETISVFLCVLVCSRLRGSAVKDFFDSRRAMDFSRRTKQLRRAPFHNSTFHHRPLNWPVQRSCLYPGTS